MNSIEEKIWNFIDGTCTPEEQQAISKLIETDEEYRTRYKELLALNLEFEQIELEEPPMAFTYRVMEGIRAEEARVPLKAAINKNVIRGVVGMFVCIITVLIAYAMYHIDWAANSNTTHQLVNFKLPDMKLTAVKNVMGGSVLKAFIFFDVVLGLFFFDAYLRKQRTSKQF